MITNVPDLKTGQKSLEDVGGIFLLFAFFFFLEGVCVGFFNSKINVLGFIF